MSYVQGTVITVDAFTVDPTTDEPVDVPDVIVTIIPPTLGRSTVSLLGADVLRIAKGHYQFSIDTTPEPGLWRYTIDATGDEAVVKQRDLRVIARW